MSFTEKPQTRPSAERYLTVEEFAEVTGTTPRLGRRLIAEKKIKFVRLGKYVRIPSSAVDELIARGTVEPRHRR